MEGVKKRAIIIWDVDINGDTDEVFNLHKLVNEYAKEFKEYLNAKDPDLAKKVHIEQEKAGVPQAERRGPTGDLKEIVFRGSREKNHTIKIPMRTTGTEQMISAGVKKRLQEFRNRLYKRQIFSDSTLSSMLQEECDHMMKLYNAGEPLQYTEGGSEVFYAIPAKGKTDK